MTRAITYATAGDPADVLEATEIPDPPTPGPDKSRSKSAPSRSIQETSWPSVSAHHIPDSARSPALRPPESWLRQDPASTPLRSAPA